MGRAFVVRVTEGCVWVKVYVAYGGQADFFYGFLNFADVVSGCRRPELSNGQFERSRKPELLAMFV